MKLAAERTVEEKSLWMSRLVGAVGFALIAYIALGLLAGAGWNPTLFIKFDEHNPPLQQYAGQRFDEVILAGGDGHDGKYFFIQASDPFYLHPDEHAFLLDRPTYRAQRMLYPTIAGGFGILPPSAIAWALVSLNVAAVGIGTYLTSRVAVRLGLSPMFGLAFFVNPAVFVSAVINTAEVFAMVFLIAGLLMVLERRTVPAAGFLTLSALSRETMLLCVAGWIIFELLTHKRFHWIMALPFGAVGMWWLFLRSRIGYLSGDLQDTQALGTPFRGFSQSVEQWLGTSAHLDDAAIGIALLLVGVFFALLALRRMSLIPLMASGFSVLGVLMVREVWMNYFDATRALTPLLTFFFLALPSARREHPEGFM